MKKIKICKHLVVWPNLLLIAGAVALFFLFPANVGLEVKVLNIVLIVLPAISLLAYLLAGNGVEQQLQNEKDEAIAAALRNSFEARRDGRMTGSYIAERAKKDSLHTAPAAYVPAGGGGGYKYVPSGDTGVLMSYDENAYSRVKCPYCDTEYDASESTCPVCGMARGK